MKVYFKPNNTTFPKGGKKDGIIYCYSFHGKRCIGRNYFEVKPLKQQDNIISMQQLTLTVWKRLPISFKKDLSLYTQNYKKIAPALRAKHISVYSIFLKISHHFNKSSQINHEIMTPNSLLQSLNYLSVYTCIQLNILPDIPQSYKLNKMIDPVLAKTPFNKKEILHNYNHINPLNSYAYISKIFTLNSS